MSEHGTDERRVYRWLAAHTRAVDAAIAVGFGVVTVGPYLLVGLFARELGVLGLAALGALLVAPIALRRSHPLLTAGVVLLTSVFQLVFAVQVVAGDLAVLVVIASLAAHAPRWASRSGLAAGVAGMGVLAIRYPAMTGNGATSPPTEIVVVAVLGWSMVVAAWLAGDVTRSRLAERRALAARAASLEYERDQEHAIAAAAERARIAREMHDVVAHSLSIIVRQADGARFLAGDGGGPASTALEVIGDTARDSLAEMRRLLGVLHDEGDAPTAPAPTLDDLEPLVGQVRQAGVDVAFERHGEPPAALAAGAALVMFRVVQESLTNVMKHAGAGARAEVRLAWQDDVADLTVRDHGPGLAGGRGGGRGIDGMRDRLALYGGTLEVADAPDGGVRVHAVLPTGATR